jgi:hypothetical protein
VRATVDDGTGSGPASAALTFDACPGAVACSWPGTVVSQAGGSTVFSFLVPRMAQSELSEVPLAVTVTALDVAGNQGQGAGSLLIDDAQPAIGSLSLISTGVTGEDGNTWFKGGAGANPVEIAVPLTDSGVGPAKLALHLNATDLTNPPASLDITAHRKPTAGTFSSRPTRSAAPKGTCASR